MFIDKSFGLFAIILSFLITLVFIQPFINFLNNLKFQKKTGGVGSMGKALIDKLQDFKSGTPIGGGILLIVLVTMLFSFFFILSNNFDLKIISAYQIKDELVIIFATFIGFGALGFIDDWVKIRGKQTPGTFGSWIGLSRRTKILAQIFLSLIIGSLLHFQLGIDSLYIPLLRYNIVLGPFYILFSSFVIIYFSNAFNFTDGLDGLASGLLIILLSAYLLIAFAVIDVPLFVFISLLLGSVMAFLLFNIYPATIFLGDAGALSFGAMIAVIGLLMGNIVALFVIGGVFFFEAASSVIQIVWWKIFKRKFFPIAPIHHTFLAIGWQEPKIVMRAWIIGIILAIFGLWLATI